jgi:hypothetical protein
VPEIGTPGLMSGDGKRGVGHRPQATAPILDSTEPDVDWAEVEMKEVGGLIPRNAINADSTAQIATAGPSLANALFFDFTGNQ